MEEQEKVRNMPDPDMPAGHKLMPTEERYETLDLLKQSMLRLTTIHVFLYQAFRCHSENTPNYELPFTRVRLSI